MRKRHRDGRGWSPPGATLALAPGLLPQGASLHAVTQTIGAVPMAPRLLTMASVGLGLGLLAGLVSLRTYHASSDRMAPSLEPTDRLPVAVRPAEDMADGATRLDDVMLVVLVVGLFACAVFVWLNLGRLMANG